MKKFKGIHMYIEIKNFNDVVENEQKKTGKVTKSIHLLNTYFSSIERYCSKNGYKLQIEKITGSRLHLYTEEDITQSINSVIEVTCYSYKLSKRIISEISKYNGLDELSIRIGAAYGKYYDYVFDYENNDEYTSIGYACNYSAKILNITNEYYFSVDSDIYNILNPVFKKSFIRKTISTMPDHFYYSSSLKDIYSIFTKNDKVEKAIDEDIENANKIKLSDIEFSEIRDSINFDNITVENCKSFSGVALFIDIRDFSKQFDKDDINLDEMAAKTKNVLELMYKEVIRNKGTHIQFQGDREFAIYYSVNPATACKNAIITGLHLIDNVKSFNISVGVGSSYGKLYITKIGLRNNKDNIVLGKTVNDADENEDSNANKNWMVISEDMYQKIKDNKALADLFDYNNEKHFYYTSRGYQNYCNLYEHYRLKENNKNNNYNGAWGNGL